jgi:hypothetical protein
MKKIEPSKGFRSHDTNESTSLNRQILGAGSYRAHIQITQVKTLNPKP